MIIARSPLRITLGGGGTDVPSYYQPRGGFAVAAAIDKYIYIVLHDTFDAEVIVKYSHMERVQSASEVQHPIVREALELVGVTTSIEVASMADIPAGTGLGSSGSFTTALLKALYAARNESIQADQLARLACDIELNRLGEPIGKQDQYAAAYGGLRAFGFECDDSVTVSSLALPSDTIYNLEDNLLLFFTGVTRSAGSVLGDQDRRARLGDAHILGNLDAVKQLGLASKAALEGGDLTEFALLLNEQWNLKQIRNPGDTTSQDLAEWRQAGLANGASGAKLVGAGGGGFLLFYADDHVRLRRKMAELGLREVRFRFDFEGSKVVSS